MINQLQKLKSLIIHFMIIKMLASFIYAEFVADYNYVKYSLILYALYT